MFNKMLDKVTKIPILTRKKAKSKKKKKKLKDFKWWTLLKYTGTFILKCLCFTIVSYLFRKKWARYNMHSYNHLQHNHHKENIIIFHQQSIISNLLTMRRFHWLQTLKYTVLLKFNNHIRLYAQIWDLLKWLRCLLYNLRYLRLFKYLQGLVFLHVLRNTFYSSSTSILSHKYKLEWSNAV